VNTPAYRLDRRALVRAFDRASSGYDQAARLQSNVRSELLARLEFFKLEPRIVLDLGTGTGDGAAALRRRYRSAQVLALDIAPGMLRQASRRLRLWRRFERVCGDALQLPLRDASVDLLFSNLMLQWCDQPQMVFAEMSRVLRPGGLVCFSTFGPETLMELRAAWAAADARPHVTEFPSLPQLGAGMQRASLMEPVMDVERIVSYYPDAMTLMRELQSIGARNASAERHRALTGRRRLAQLVAGYEHLREAAGLPATYEIIYGAAFGGGPQPTQMPPGEHRVPLPIPRRREDAK
jgi:malonyl-CoA O-methyltransferase